MRGFDMNSFAFIFLGLVLIAFGIESTIATRSTYIVHMDKSFMPKAFTTHHDWYSTTIDSLKVIGPTEAGAVTSTPALLYSYDNVMHGFSAVLSLDELHNLQKSHGFVSAYADSIVKLDTTHTFKFLSLNPDFGLWPASEFGKDVIVGMIDSGVWPESESFNDVGMTEVPKRWKGACHFNSSLCNRKLIGARSFIKGAMAANPHSETDVVSPRDQIGHGTHTSTTVAGNYVEGVSFFGYAKGTARGIAPRARVAMYKVAGSLGQSSDILAGMDAAISDGVDVISISMGINGFPLYEDPIAIASFAAMEKGVFVSSSAGNNGPSLRSLHNGTPWVLTVAAGTIDRQFSAELILGNDKSITGWSLFLENRLLVDLQLVYNKTLLPCNSSVLLSKSAAGKIVICDQTWPLEDQIDYVSGSKVAGAIFFSDDSQYMEVGSLTSPGLVVHPVNAPLLLDYIKSTTKPTATIKFQQDILGGKPAPTVAFYSSRGPSPAYPGILKPDLMAPGSQVLAAWIPNVVTGQIGSDVSLTSGYNMISGTSMACPHASGVAALLKGAHPDWSPAAIRSAMMTTANPFDNTNGRIRDNGAKLRQASPLAMGAGHIDPNKALNPGLVYDVNAQDYVNHLCYMNFTSKQILAITRSSDYNCSNPSSDLNYPSFMAFFNNTPSTFQEFQRTVTNVGDGASTYKAKLIVPKKASLEISISPDTLVFHEKYEKLSFTLSVNFPQTNRTHTYGYGYLIWEDDEAKHSVKSPIVAFRLT